MQGHLHKLRFGGCPNWGNLHATPLLLHVTRFQFPNWSFNLCVICLLWILVPLSTTFADLNTPACHSRLTPKYKQCLWLARSQKNSGHMIIRSDTYNDITARVITQKNAYL